MPVARPRALDARARAVAVLVAAFSVGGCYKPTITDNGFLCASTGKACPDGFTCVDNHCTSMPDKTQPPPQMDSGGMDVMMTMMSDGGTDAGPMCMAPAALCPAGPAAGEACSAACQRGCACGRCNIVDGVPVCVAAGSVKLGDVCLPSADNCGPGLICLLEMCGSGLARCYRHCTTNDQCDATACTIGIEDSQGNPTPYMTCDVPPQTCNPVAVGSGSGCPDPALNCYLTSANQTLCDCPSRPASQGGNNAECTIYSDCAAGFICIKIPGLDMQGTARCHFVCDISAPSCPTSAGADGGAPVPQRCMPTGTGAKYGYCSI